MTHIVLSIASLYSHFYIRFIYCTLSQLEANKVCRNNRPIKQIYTTNFFIVECFIFAKNSKMIKVEVQGQR